METLIQQLIESRKEGTWWDFKREHHKSSFDLLHDILCLSNAIHSGDRYLIIGVSEDFDLVDVRDNRPRRNQSDILDMLKKKNFAEDIIPCISLVTISKNGSEIDIIVIKNERVKPYYLLSDEREANKILKSGVVYSRVGDTNTPINACANPRDVGVMWRERFGLTQAAEERFKSVLLEFENWRYDGISKAYYSLDPDYSIEIEQGEKKGQYWWQLEYFEKPTAFDYVLKYKDKELYKIPVLRFHGENLSFPFPNIEYVAYPDDGITSVECYCDLFCYIKGSIGFSLLCHIRAMEVGGKEAEEFISTPIRTQIKPPIISLPFLIFEDDDSKNSAIEKLRNKIDEFKELSSGKDKCERIFSEWAFNQINGE